jgi:hypothetical protein
MGDGVLLYFGYPKAHADDAERAVRAGLELIGAVTALKAASPLQTRVGVTTRLVVVGDLIGAGEAQEQSIVGEIPNLHRAARDCGAKHVAIAESTRKLLGEPFELKDLCPGSNSRRLTAHSRRTRAALDAWRADYNTNRPHSRLGWMSPASYAADRRSAALRYTDGAAPRTAVTTAQEGNVERQTPIAAG